MNLTELFGKQVYSLYEGEIVATIIGANFNNLNNKIKSFTVFDSEDNEFELSTLNIKAMTDCIIITNQTKLDVTSSLNKNSPMFKNVIDENAKECGKIIDAEIDEQGNILYFITDKQISIKPENIYIRKHFIYFSSTPIKISSYKPRTKKVTTLSDIKVNVLTFNKTETETNFLPQKVQFNSNAIIGKIAKNDLFGVNNELIIRANQTITEKIINDATRHNRLNQLFYIAI